MAKHEEIIANQEALTEAANQSVLALDLVKSAIERSGTEVADGTPVSEYGGMIDGIYEAGQQDVLNALSNNGTRTEWQYGFRRADFSGRSFPQKVHVTNCYQMFANYEGKYLLNGFDFSNQSSHDMQWLCRYAQVLKVFPDMGIKAQERYGGTWQGCYELETVELIRCNENTVFDASFSGCSKLKDVAFEGTIGQNISFGECGKLTKASIENIIAHLSDTASGKTATFKKTAATLAFGTPESSTEWQNLVATKQNWTISLV